MNTQRRVFEKLSATKDNSKKIKVDLGIRQDLDDAVAAHKSARTSIDNSLDLWFKEMFKLKESFSVIEKQYSNFESTIDDLKKYSKEIEDMASDLGIQTNAFEGYVQSTALLNTVDDMTEVYRDAKSITDKLN